MSYLTDESNEHFNPSTPDDKPSIPLDVLPAVASRAIRNFDPNTFRVVLNVAIDQGLVSKQTLGKRFGSNVLVAIRKDATLDPATSRGILSYISELDPSEATGAEQNWKHTAQEKNTARDRVPSRSYAL